MTPTNYTEKAREHRAAEKKLRDAAADLAAALRGLIADWERVTGRVIPENHEAKAALKKAGVTL